MIGWLVLILFVKALLMAAYVTGGAVGLGPDEAQYWTWSKALDFGYYSKPPGIAWQIALGTGLFGDTELGVRFGSIVLGALIPLAVYFLARSCRLKETTAFWAALALAFSPLGMLSSLFAITDVGMVFFWTLGCIVIARGLAQGALPHYYLLGICIALGALWKWPAYLLWIFPLLLMPLYRNLRSYHYIGGFALSLLGLLPSIYWNWQHDWATFQHVFTTVKGGHGGETGTTMLFHGNFWDFVGAQAGLLSPVLFVLLLAAFYAMLRRIKEIWPPVLFCGMVSFLILSLYAVISLFQKMQGNWVDFAYPTAVVLLAWYCFEGTSWGKMWMKGGIALSLLLMILTLSVPYLQNIPYKMNPFRHNMGWKEMGEQLQKSGYDPETEFLFSDKYQMSSVLSFYGPKQKRAYFLNLHDARRNQFSYWPGMAEEQIGNSGYFVLAENSPYLERDAEERIAHYQKALEPYFNRVEYLGTKPMVQTESALLKGALIYRVTGYNGKEPSPTSKF